MSDWWEGIKAPTLTGLAGVNLTLTDNAEEGPRPDITAGAVGAAAEPGRARSHSDAGVRGRKTASWDGTYSR